MDDFVLSTMRVPRTRGLVNGKPVEVQPYVTPSWVLAAMGIDVVWRTGRRHGWYPAKPRVWGRRDTGVLGDRHERRSAGRPRSVRYPCTPGTFERH